jgi:hypothetical protein
VVKLVSAVFLMLLVGSAWGADSTASYAPTGMSKHIPGFQRRADNGYVCYGSGDFTCPASGGGCCFNIINSPPGAIRRHFCCERGWQCICPEGQDRCWCDDGRPDTTGNENNTNSTPDGD